MVQWSNAETAPRTSVQSQRAEPARRVSARSQSVIPGKVAKAKSATTKRATVQSAKAESATEKRATSKCEIACFQKAILVSKRFFWLLRTQNKPNLP